MTTFRCTVVLDFEAPDGKDPDEFHDELRDRLEATELGELLPDLESVRDIEVEDLED